MQARIARHEDVTVVSLSGRVDVETAEPFREACLNHLANKKVVFDFKSLSFVGSSGILPFLETMQNYATGNAGLFNFSGVGVEFRRVFSATPLHSVAIYDTHLQAVEELLRPKTIASAAQMAPLVDSVTNRADVAPLVPVEAPQSPASIPASADTSQTIAVKRF